MRPLSLSPAERTAIGIAVIVLISHAGGDALEYRRGLLTTEPWRVLTAHLVHVGLQHALVNLAALWLIARLFADELPPRRLLALAGLSAIGISLALAFGWPAIAWYRGLSGVLHALYFGGATLWLVTTLRARSGWLLPLTLTAGGWLKLALERPWGHATPYAEWLGANVVPQAHGIGALCGTLAALLWAAQRARGSQREQQQQLTERQ